MEENMTVNIMEESVQRVETDLVNLPGLDSALLTDHPACRAWSETSSRPRLGSTRIITTKNWPGFPMPGHGVGS
jgi:hypothetical protein